MLHASCPCRPQCQATRILPVSATMSSYAPCDGILCMNIALPGMLPMLKIACLPSIICLRLSLFSLACITRVGDFILQINGSKTQTMSHDDILAIFKSQATELNVVIQMPSDTAGLPTFYGSFHGFGAHSCRCSGGTKKVQKKTVFVSILWHHNNGTFHSGLQIVFHVAHTWTKLIRAW